MTPDGLVWEFKLRPNLKFHDGSAITAEDVVYSFQRVLALGLAPSATTPEPDPTEALVLARVPFREALDAALAGQLPDMLTVAMLLRGYHMAREGALPGVLSRAMLG